MKKFLIILFLIIGFVYGETVNETEPNNDFSTASSIKINQTGKGYLTNKYNKKNNDTKDYWKFHLSQKGILTITIKSENKKVAAILYDNNKKQILKGSGKNINLTQLLNSGDYYILIQKKWTGKHSTNYQIKFNFIPLSIDSNAKFSCPGEDVKNVNGATGDASASYDTFGKTVSNKGGRYFKFKTNVDGTITISEYALDNNKYKLLIGTSCNGNDIYNGKRKKSDSITFSISAGTMYYVKVQEANKNNILNFHIDFDFKKAKNNLTSSTGVYHNGEREFYLVNPSDTRNIIGNTLVIGNTVECVSKKYFDYVDKSGQEYYNYPNSISQLQSSECSNDLAQNDNNYFIKYIDVDNDNTTFNSSSAIIQFPSTYKKIVWAGLFWQGHINSYSYQYLDEDGFWHISNDFPGDIKDTNANQVKIKIGNGQYQTVTAKEVDYFNDSRYISGLGRRYGVEYSAYADVTKLFDGNITSNTKITVADIATSRGLEPSLGDYGAWTLVLIYKEDEHNKLSKLRNNSVFYGYKQIYNNHPDTITVSGFLLPKHGTVDSHMAVFAGEGEYTYYPDYMKLDGTELGSNTCNADGNTPSCKTNVFDAKLSPNIQRIPFLTNNNGIDIDIFDTSSIMTKKRDNNPDAKSYSATIDLSSNWDMYFPSMVLFTTELYKPRVCYYFDKITDEKGNVIFENGGFVKNAKIYPDEEYNITIWISNMKKSANDTDVEDAKNVKIFMTSHDFNYTRNSTFMKNIGWDDFRHQTDAPNDDLFTYLSDQNESDYHVGKGATASEGGEVDVTTFGNVAGRAYINFLGNFVIEKNETSIDLNQTFTFKASFETDTIKISDDNAEPIEPCVNINTVGNIGGILGKFNIVNRNGGNRDFNDVNSPQNQLYTQIVNKTFTVKVIHLNSSLDGLDNYTGEINVTLIQNPFSDTDTDEEKQIKCNNAVPLTSWIPVQFNNENSKLLNFVYNKADKDVRFKIKYVDRGEVKYACSTDDFAIRPKNYTILPINQKLIAGKDVNITIKAVDENNNTVSNFTFLNAPIELNISDAKGCRTGRLNKPSALDTTVNFVNGEANLTLNYSEIGNLNISVKEYKNGNEFAKVDADDPIDSSGNIEDDQDLLIGEGNTTLKTFYPAHFAVSASYSNFNSKNFTYISNELNMSSLLNITITAQNEQNGTTQNYNVACYAKPFDINISHSVPSGVNLNILYKDKFGSEQNVSITSPLRFTSLPASYFTTANRGVAHIPVNINFEKKYNTPVNEFNFTIKDINVSDVNGTFGTFSLDQNATFRYGSIIVNNVSGYDTKELNFTAQYMYYKNNTWKLNMDHNSTDFGEINLSKSIKPSDITLNVIQKSGKNVYEGVEKIKAVTTHALPYSAKVHLSIPSWLWYHPLATKYEDPSSSNLNCLTHPCVKLTFLKSGKGWAGIGRNSVKYNEQNVTVETNLSKETNISKEGVKKLNW